MRETYRYAEDHRGTLSRLREATKDYSPLHVHVWRKSGSKSGFERHGDDLVTGIVETILTKPTEEWLIVTHQVGNKVGNIDAKMRRRLPAEVADKVKTLTWGNHMATNLYADVPNVILAGTLFLRPAHYTALTHLGQDRDVAGGLASSEDVKRTERGEHANLVLQALCRGRVRKSYGSQCLPMTAYIIASTRSGIPDDLTAIFPKCVVKTWSVGRTELTGRPAEAMQFIGTALETAAWVSYRDVARGLGIDMSALRKLVLKHRHWDAAFADSPFEEATGPRNARGVRLRDHQDASMAA